MKFFIPVSFSGNVLSMLGIRICLTDIIHTLFFDRFFDRFEHKPTHINLCDFAERMFQKFLRVVISQTNEGKMGIFQSQHPKLAQFLNCDRRRKVLRQLLTHCSHLLIATSVPRTD